MRAVGISCQILGFFLGYPEHFLGQEWSFLAVLSHELWAIKQSNTGTADSDELTCVGEAELGCVS